MDEFRSHVRFSSLKPNYFSEIASAAGFVVVAFSEVQRLNGKFTEEGMRRLDFLARTPVVSKAYAPHVATTFAVGLTELLREKNLTFRRECMLWILDLFAFAGLVDGHVIGNLVAYGADMDDYADAQDVANSVFCAVHTASETGEWKIPNDSRYSIAIEKGLFEMILVISTTCVNSLLAAFRLGAADALLNTMNHLVNGAVSVALMKRSSVAIARCCDTIQDEVLKLKRDCSFDPKRLVIIDAIHGIMKQSNSIRSRTTRRGCWKCWKAIDDHKVCKRCMRATCKLPCIVARHFCKSPLTVFMFRL